MKKKLIPTLFTAICVLTIFKVGRTNAGEDSSPLASPAPTTQQIMGTAKATGTGRLMVDDGSTLQLAGGITYTLTSVKIKTTYLGVEAVSADATLRAQLKLPNGVGLAVRHVVEQSPAYAAGLREYDVIYKINDQLMINSEQLRVLIRTFKAGEQVELNVIREAQPLKLTAKLVEKEQEDIPVEAGNLMLSAPANGANTFIRNPNDPAIPGRLPNEWRISAPNPQPFAPN